MQEAINGDAVGPSASLDALVLSMLTCENTDVIKQNALSALKIIECRSIMKPVIGSIENEKEPERGLNGGANVPRDEHYELSQRVGEVAKKFLGRISHQICIGNSTQPEITDRADEGAERLSFRNTRKESYILPDDAYLRILGPALKPRALSAASVADFGEVLDGIFNEREEHSRTPEDVMHMLIGLDSTYRPPTSVVTYLTQMTHPCSGPQAIHVCRSYCHTPNEYDASIGITEESTYRFGREKSGIGKPILTADAALIWRTLYGKKRTLIAHVIILVLRQYQGVKRLKSGAVTTITSGSYGIKEVEGQLDSFVENIPQGQAQIIVIESDIDKLETELFSEHFWIPDPNLPAIVHQDGQSAVYHEQISTPYWNDNYACISIYFSMVGDILARAVESPIKTHLQMLLMASWTEATEALVAMFNRTKCIIEENAILRVLLYKELGSENALLPWQRSLLASPDGQSRDAISLGLARIGFNIRDILSSYHHQDTGSADVWSCFLFYCTCICCIDHALQCQRNRHAARASTTNAAHWEETYAHVSYLIKQCTHVVPFVGSSENVCTAMLEYIKYANDISFEFDSQKYPNLNCTLLKIMDISRGTYRCRHEEISAFKLFIDWYKIEEFAVSILHSAPPGYRYLDRTKFQDDHSLMNEWFSRKWREYSLRSVRLSQMYIKCKFGHGIRGSGTDTLEVRTTPIETARLRYPYTLSLHYLCTIGGDALDHHFGEFINFLPSEPRRSIEVYNRVLKLQCQIGSISEQIEDIMREEFSVLEELTKDMKAGETTFAHYVDHAAGLCGVSSDTENKIDDVIEMIYNKNCCNESKSTTMPNVMVIQAICVAYYMKLAEALVHVNNMIAALIETIAEKNRTAPSVRNTICGEGVFSAMKKTQTHIDNAIQKIRQANTIINKYGENHVVRFMPFRGVDTRLTHPTCMNEISGAEINGVGVPLINTLQNALDMFLPGGSSADTDELQLTSLVAFIVDDVSQLTVFTLSSQVVYSPRLDRPYAGSLTTRARKRSDQVACCINEFDIHDVNSSTLSRCYGVADYAMFCNSALEHGRDYQSYRKFIFELVQTMMHKEEVSDEICRWTPMTASDTAWHQPLLLTSIEQQQVFGIVNRYYLYDLLDKVGEGEEDKVLARRRWGEKLFHDSPARTAEVKNAIISASSEKSQFIDDVFQPHSKMELANYYDSSVIHDRLTLDPHTASDFPNWPAFVSSYGREIDTTGKTTGLFVTRDGTINTDRALDCAEPNDDTQCLMMTVDVINKKVVQITQMGIMPANAVERNNKRENKKSDHRKLIFLDERKCYVGNVREMFDSPEHMVHRRFGMRTSNQIANSPTYTDDMETARKFVRICRTLANPGGSDADMNLGKSLTRLCNDSTMSPEVFYELWRRASHDKFDSAGLNALFSRGNDDLITNSVAQSISETHITGGGARKEISIAVLMHVLSGIQPRIRPNQRNEQLELEVRNVNELLANVLITGLDTIRKSIRLLVHEFQSTKRDTDYVQALLFLGPRIAHVLDENGENVYTTKKFDTVSFDGTRDGRAVKHKMPSWELPLEQVRCAHFNEFNVLVDTTACDGEPQCTLLSTTYHNGGHPARGNRTLVVTGFFDIILKDLYTHLEETGKDVGMNYLARVISAFVTPVQIENVSSIAHSDERSMLKYDAAFYVGHNSHRLFSIDDRTLSPAVIDLHHKLKNFGRRIPIELTENVRDFIRNYSHQNAEAAENRCKELTAEVDQWLREYKSAGAFKLGAGGAESITLLCLQFVPYFDKFSNCGQNILIKVIAPWFSSKGYFADREWYRSASRSIGSFDTDFRIGEHLFLLPILCHGLIDSVDEYLKKTQPNRRYDVVSEIVQSALAQKEPSPEYSAEWMSMECHLKSAVWCVLHAWRTKCKDAAGTDSTLAAREASEIIESLTDVIEKYVDIVHVCDTIDTNTPVDKWKSVKIILNKTNFMDTVLVSMDEWTMKMQKLEEQQADYELIATHMPGTDDDYDGRNINDLLAIGPSVTEFQSDLLEVEGKLKAQQNVGNIGIAMNVMDKVSKCVLFCRTIAENLEKKGPRDPQTRDPQTEIFVYLQSFATWSKNRDLPAWIQEYLEYVKGYLIEVFIPFLNYKKFKMDVPSHETVEFHNVFKNGFIRHACFCALQAKRWATIHATFSGGGDDDDDDDDDDAEVYEPIPVHGVKSSDAHNADKIVAYLPVTNQYIFFEENEDANEPTSIDNIKTTEKTTSDRSLYYTIACFLLSENETTETIASCFQPLVVSKITETVNGRVQGSGNTSTYLLKYNVFGAGMNVGQLCINDGFPIATMRLNRPVNITEVKVHNTTIKVVSPGSTMTGILSLLKPSREKYTNDPYGNGYLEGDEGSPCTVQHYLSRACPSLITSPRSNGIWSRWMEFVLTKASGTWSSGDQNLQQIRLALVAMMMRMPGGENVLLSGINVWKPNEATLLAMTDGSLKNALTIIDNESRLHSGVSSEWAPRRNEESITIGRDYRALMKVTGEENIRGWKANDIFIATPDFPDVGSTDRHPLQPILFDFWTIFKLAIGIFPPTIKGFPNEVKEDCVRFTHCMAHNFKLELGYFRYAAPTITHLAMRHTERDVEIGTISGKMLQLKPGDKIWITTSTNSKLDYKCVGECKDTFNVVILPDPPIFVRSEKGVRRLLHVTYSEPSDAPTRNITLHDGHKKEAQKQLAASRVVGDGGKILKLGRQSVFWTDVDNDVLVRHSETEATERKNFLHRTVMFRKGLPNARTTAQTQQISSAKGRITELKNNARNPGEWKDYGMMDGPQEQLPPASAIRVVCDMLIFGNMKTKRRNAFEDAERFFPYIGAMRSNECPTLSGCENEQQVSNKPERIEVIRALLMLGRMEVDEDKTNTGMCAMSETIAVLDLDALFVSAFLFFSSKRGEAYNGYRSDKKTIRDAIVHFSLRNPTNDTNAVPDSPRTDEKFIVSEDPLVFNTIILKTVTKLLSNIEITRLILMSFKSRLDWQLNDKCKDALRTILKIPLATDQEVTDVSNMLANIGSLLQTLIGLYTNAVTANCGSQSSNLSSEATNTTLGKLDTIDRAVM